MSNQGNNIATGTKTMTGAAIQLITDSSLNGMSSIAIKNNAANTRVVYIGKDNRVDATTGFELSIGQTISMDLLNGSKIWVLGTAPDVVSFMGLLP